ncbi:MAG: hypothetical protein WC211_05005 [Dehalococcoidia bacterium]
MTRLLVALIAGVLALVEVSVAAGSASAVLPLALIACWGVLRGVDEVVLAAPTVALALGVTSEERVGWFLLALIPLLIALVLVERGRQRGRSAAVGAAVAGGGSLAYGIVLLLAAGQPRALPAAAPALLAVSSVTALLSALGVLLLWRWRAQTHTRGLFA